MRTQTVNQAYLWVVVVDGEHHGRAFAFRVGRVRVCPRIEEQSFDLVILITLILESPSCVHNSSDGPTEASERRVAVCAGCVACGKRMRKAFAVTATPLGRTNETGGGALQ